ncbi:Type 1 glutamine amidotransferase-like domain-containing protein [Paenibacillus sp. FSL K6-1558]|uniref:Type 1 glutamine amidotransferase-like domain-containing protein n=1 Tax=Paenibacillus sp. FSL K6-1558 TaxID=2921473 RepID=UPI0012B6DE3D|nr:Type 1 glutamine amidotransferase-like domain-containing protein [Paenibacillus xylanexedens]
MAQRKLILLSDLYFERNDELNERIRSLFQHKKPSIGYIPSCSDPQRIYVEHTRRFYRQFGMEDVQYYDLDTEYEESMLDSLFQCDAIHLSGGNTFYFLSLLQQRNRIEQLRSYVSDGGILIGVSAGSILMTPTIQIAGYGEDADENHIGLTDLQALALVDFEFAPHWDRSEEMMQSFREYAQNHQSKVYACPDGGAVVVENESLELYGGTTPAL